MKQMNYILIVFMALSFSVNAEIFKCKSMKGGFIYQAEPCTSGEIPQGTVKVKQMTPEETEAAKAKLKAWQSQQAVEEAKKREQEMRRQEEMERQESLALQRRSVMAQERQAIAAQQRPYIGGGAVFIPSYGYNGRSFGNPIYPPFSPITPNILPQQQPNKPFNQNNMPPAPWYPQHSHSLPESPASGNKGHGVRSFEHNP